MENPTYTLKDLNFEFDLSNADYQMDILQNKLLQTYIRADPKFRKAFSVNFTSEFIQFLKDKARLHEPVSLSVIGVTRCQRKGSKVLMANGEWKNIEDIKIGDEVLSPQKDKSYKYSKVIGTSQHLSKDNFWVCDRKNEKLYHCSGNHIIPTFFRGTLRIDKKNENSKRKADWKYSEREAKDFQYLDKTRHSYFLISTFPINCFKGRKNCEIDPYSLGFYLGDGHFTTALGITTSNVKIITKISKIYPFMNINNKKGTMSKTYLFSRNSKLAKLLIKYGLKDKKSGDKFIPKEALLSDVRYRRKLLAGLIDTDGNLSKELAYSITTKSKQLAEDILSLVKSLGGYGKTMLFTAYIKKLNFKGDYYKVSFYLGKEIEKIPLIKKNKVRVKKDYWKFSANRVSFCVDKASPELVYGIEVDSPSKWYVTDNYLITHNSSKSYISIGIQAIIMALSGKMVTAEYICPNAMDFLERLRTMPQEKLTNSCFLIDEEKTAMFGYGSMAKKMKLQDVANIVAINNISTISLNPISWANREAMYGLRTFGRCFKTRTSRLMLYNLQAGGRGGESPMGCLYLPIFTSLLPKPYAEKLEKDYLAKKNAWVMQEQRGEGDILAEMRKRLAEDFIRDKTFLSITKKNERLAYIELKLGSEWTTSECKSILLITQLINQGVNLG
jgi:hypothetical protein